MSRMRGKEAAEDADLAVLRSVLVASRGSLITAGRGAVVVVVVVEVATVLFSRSGGDYKELQLRVMFFDCIVMACLDVN